MDNHFGVRIKECRQNKKLTQKELGDLIGVSAQVISNIERGYTTGIGPDEIARLIIILETTADYLILGIKKEVLKDIVSPFPHIPINSDESLLLKCYREATSSDKDVIWMLLKKYQKNIVSPENSKI